MERKSDSIASGKREREVEDSGALIQKMVDGTLQAEKYHTDGGQSYLGVDFFGRHERNIRDKSDTHNIEGSNADIRHYIAGLRRRSGARMLAMTAQGGTVGSSDDGGLGADKLEAFGAIFAGANASVAQGRVV